MKLPVPAAQVVMVKVAAPTGAWIETVIVGMALRFSRRVLQNTRGKW